jgi:hypothetical protein
MKKAITTGAVFAMASVSSLALANDFLGSDNMKPPITQMIWDFVSSGVLPPDMTYVSGGTEQALAALVNGTQSIVPMARRPGGDPANPSSEKGQIFRSTGSYSERVLGLDAVSVYVLGDQGGGDVAPVQMSKDQLLNLFSGNGTGNIDACAARTIRNFEDLRDPSTTRRGPINLYLPSDQSSTYAILKDLGITGFCPDVQKVRDCDDPVVTHGVIIETGINPDGSPTCSATDQLAARTSWETAAMALMGLSGLGPGNARLAVASAFGGAYVAPTPGNVAAFSYPLSGRLWLIGSGHSPYPDEELLGACMASHGPNDTCQGIDYYLAWNNLVVCSSSPVNNPCLDLDLIPGDQGTCRF